MNKLDPVIDALHNAIEMEKSLKDYYKHASHHAKDSHLADRLRGMEDLHLTFASRVEARREALQKEAGEGLIANALEKIGEAIHDTIAGLPVGLIRTETDPTVEMLVRHEEELLRLYEGLRDGLDPETTTLLDAAAENCRENIRELQQIGAL